MNSLFNITRLILIGFRSGLGQSFRESYMDPLICASSVPLKIEGFLVRAHFSEFRHSQSKEDPVHFHNRSQFKVWRLHGIFFCQKTGQMREVVGIKPALLMYLDHVIYSLCSGIVVVLKLSSAHQLSLSVFINTEINCGK